MVYHRLGIKVRSPFFNMWEKDREYVEFLKNAEHIMENEKLHFCGWEYNDGLKIDYPVYDLAGMKLYMNHYPEREIAEHKWHERSERINWNNLFVMMYSDDLYCVEEFSRLPYQKKVCFSSLHVDIPGIYYIPLEKVAQKKMLWQVVNGSVVGKYKLYDLIELLINGKAVYTDRIKWV